MDILSGQNTESVKNWSDWLCFNASIFVSDRPKNLQGISPFSVCFLHHFCYHLRDTKLIARDCCLDFILNKKVASKY